MAEEQKRKSESKETTPINYQIIYDMGSGLDIGKVNIDQLKEQNLNARIMKKEMQDQLTTNIKNRGQLESLPFLALKDGQLEVISGHHRIRSARAAGMKELICIIDHTGLSRSKIAAKQLAHNAISGFDDDSTLREIAKMLDDVDDMLESFVGKDFLEEPMKEYDKMASPAVHFDFKNVTFTFLPHQINDMDALVKSLEDTAPDIIGTAAYDDCQRFVETLSKYQKFADIRNVGAAVHSMIETVQEKMDGEDFDEEEDYTYLTKIFGSNAIPSDSAEIINKALKKAEKEGVISSKNKWLFIEMLATEYLGK